MALFLAMTTRNVLADGREPIRYVALGDSYTIGRGVSPEEAWPAVLVKHLQREGVDVSLLANLGSSGSTAEDVRAVQVPIYRNLKADFVSLLIGSNDWVRGVSPEEFRGRLSGLMDEIIAALPKKDRLLIVTIPDFSVTPLGPEFSVGRDISRGLGRFNKIIKEEATKRKLAVVDIFPMSRDAEKDNALISDDGLHPSARGYAAWEEAIFPVAKKILKKR